MQYLLDGVESNRLQFRPVTISDYEAWLEFFKSEQTSRHWNYVKDDPNAECLKWYQKQFEKYHNNEGGMNALIAKGSGKLIGHCGLSKQTVDNVSELEIGYSLLPMFWNLAMQLKQHKNARSLRLIISCQHR